MKRIIHKIKYRIRRFFWYFEMIGYARTHAKEVDNYKFLINIREKAHQRYLELDRTDPEHTDIPKLKIQIELIDNIINYASR